MFGFYCVSAGVDRLKLLINSRIKFVAIITFAPKLIF